MLFIIIIIIIIIITIIIVCRRISIITLILSCNGHRDYENVRVPKYVSAEAVTQRSLRAMAKDAAVRLGFQDGKHNVIERRVYYDAHKIQEKNVDRSGLDVSFTIVDCPTRNKKEMLDKKIIVDVMSFVNTCIARGKSVCVVLLSSDGDFGYMLSRLRDNGAFVIIVHDSNVSSAYLETADLSFLWRDEVLRDLLVEDAKAVDGCDGTTALVSPVSSGNGISPSLASGASRRADGGDEMHGTTHPMEIHASDDVTFGLPSLPTKLSRKVSDSDSDYDGRHRSFLLCLRQKQQKQALQHPPATFEEAWVPDAGVALEFYKRKRSTAAKESALYKALRQSALEAEFI